MPRQHRIWWLSLSDLLEEAPPGPSLDRGWQIVYDSVLTAARYVRRGRGAQPPDAETVAQETMLKFLADPAKFRDDLRRAREPYSWLVTVVANEAVSWWRRRRKDALGRARHSERVLADVIGADGRADAPGDVERLRKALAALPEADRELIRLRFEDDLRVSVIAQRYGKRRGTITMRLSRSLDRLRERLGGEPAWLKLKPL